MLDGHVSNGYSVPEHLGEDVVGKFVVAEGLDLVAVGTLRGTDFTRRLRGSTAEYAFSAASVIAVKLEGLVRPVP